MNNIEIIDNFLDSSSFEELKNKLYSQQMFWTYSDILTKDKFIDITNAYKIILASLTKPAKN